MGTQGISERLAGMLYPETFKQASRFANSAKERMDKLASGPAPMNFTIWYNYAANRQPEMKKEIDEILERDGSISNVQCEDLFARYFGLDETGIEILSATRAALETIDRAQEGSRDAAARTKRYGESLEGISGDLTGGLSTAELRAMAEHLLRETVEVAKKTEALETQLTAATGQINELRGRLAQVTQDALTDALTGLANRKKFDSELRIRTRESSESGEPLCLIMADIDHFKWFNDNYGHKVGDLALRSVARIISLCIKGQDTAARYGGEEFAVILPRTSLENAAKLAEQLRTTLSSKELTHRATGKTYGSVTLSLGIAEWTGKASIPKLIDTADKALYRAKEAGRNRVVTETG